jgi:mRNA interferase RelE/StbE
LSKPFRPDIPPHVADVIRSLDPDLKKSVKAAIRSIATDPACGEPLRRELEGLWNYRVRRFRIVYSVQRKSYTVHLVAIGHRRDIYEELAARMKKEKGLKQSGIPTG